MVRVLRAGAKAEDVPVLLGVVEGQTVALMLPDPVRDGTTVAVDVGASLAVEVAVAGDVAMQDGVLVAEAP